MERVTHHGRETAYRVFDRDSSGETVLCVHGSGGSHAVWKSQSRLADEYTIVGLDLSGHGNSDDVETDPGYEALSAYVDDVVAVASAVDADILVGNSLGGAVVLETVLNREYEPSKLVLTGTGARLAVLDDLLSWLADDFERAIEFLHAPDRLFHDPSPQLVEMSLAAMQDAGQAVVSRDFQTCHTFDVREKIATIETETLAVVGEHDKLTPKHYHEYFVSEMPDCSLAVIDDAAHLPMLENPAQFNETLRSFLST